jgi:hypothetical protein
MNGIPCPCGVLISVVNGSGLEMVKSLCESWNCRDKIEIKPRTCGEHKGVEFNLDGDLKVIHIQ